MKNKKKLMKFFIYTGLIIIVLPIIALLYPTWTPDIKGENSISALEQVKINGSNHEIMIRGNDRNNPVVIFVHGGPGCPEIPYANKYQNLLESKFTVVNYDQRASGKSYHFFEDYSNLSTDLLVKDLLNMTDYISARLGKKKVILIGHSFGTYIAMEAAYKAPQKYEAYVGIGQMSDTAESEIDSLNYCIKQAQNTANTDDVLYLQGLTKEIKNDNMYTPRSYVIKYGGASRLIDNPDNNSINFLFSSEYNLLDVIRYNYGISLCQKILLKDLLKNPLPNRVTKLKLPCYFMMGKYDYMTSSSAAKKYFDIIKTDKKEFIVFEQSAHYPQFEEKKKFSKWMCDTFIK
ncbi:alpha/beta hydrolase [Clostridium estertheticum]|uniref:Alpha/beta hydrolase n=1 Tax=Clostridium estertheticum TaxID=238834 RepID=A0A5N7IS78_9CLOT|nr:alpha/beta hydrolase [Clostridium estertheticum]MPQ33183.1 alpha/beta hydrolase [Clostridium estertheticum]MPQ63841.1 alpha/beta hydrolase [Clostridium estertheticum]